MALGELVEEAQRIALVPEQVERYRLPQSLDAIKSGDSRAKKYRTRFGNLAVELGALPPATLEGLIVEAIENNLDMDLFEDEQANEAADRERLLQLRGQVRHYSQQSLPKGAPSLRHGLRQLA